MLPVYLHHHCWLCIKQYRTVTANTKYKECERELLLYKINVYFLCASSPSPMPNFCFVCLYLTVYSRQRNKGINKVEVTNNFFFHFFRILRDTQLSQVQKKTNKKKSIQFFFRQTQFMSLKKSEQEKKNENSTLAFCLTVYCLCVSMNVCVCVAHTFNMCVYRSFKLLLALVRT